MRTLYNKNVINEPFKSIHEGINKTILFETVNEKSGELTDLYYLSLYAFNDEFIKATLSEEFVKAEINEKFLVNIVIKKGNLEEKDAWDSEAILELVKELLLKLNFTDGLAYDLLKAWQAYEEIVFDIKQFYREHFIHQFKDFLFGCLFLGRLWQASKSFYDKRRFLRRWLLASMYHDIGYPAESLGEMRDNLHKRFFNKIPNYLINHIGIDTYEKNDENLPKLLKNIALIHLFSENISISDLPLSKIEHYSLPHIEIYNLLLDEFRQTIDHGVTGAVFFLKTALIDLREVVIDPSSTHKTTISTEYEPYSNLLDDLFVAASAISGHNLRTKIYPSYTVDFSSRPIGSLLNFCDDLQEWGRRSKTVRNRIYWNNGVLDLENMEVNTNSLVITYKLLEEGPLEDSIRKGLEDLLGENLKQLFVSNLSDINATFYKEIKIQIDGLDSKGKMEIELNTEEDIKKSYRTYRIGRYDVKIKD